MLVQASSGAAALVKGMKTNVGLSQPRKDTKRSVVHNASVTDNAPSSVARNNTTPKTHEKGNANTSRGSNDITRQRTNYQNNMNMASPLGDAASCT